MWLGIFLGFGGGFGRFWHFLSLVILRGFCGEVLGVS